MNDKQIAKTILQQIGGQKFVAMTGAKNFAYSSRSLSFKIPKAAKQITHVKIILDADDTYTVKFYSLKKWELRTVSEYEGLYCDALQDVVADETGLTLSIG